VHRSPKHSLLCEVLTYSAHKSKGTNLFSPYFSKISPFVPLLENDVQQQPSTSNHFWHLPTTPCTQGELVLRAQVHMSATSKVSTSTQSAHQVWCTWKTATSTFSKISLSQWTWPFFMYTIPIGVWCIPYSGVYNRRWVCFDSISQAKNLRTSTSVGNYTVLGRSVFVPQRLQLIVRLAAGSVRLRTLYFFSTPTQRFFSEPFTSECALVRLAWMDRS
jgi:hypothetical protein